MPSTSFMFLTLHLSHLSLCHPVQVVVMVILWMIWLCLMVQLCLSKRIRQCSSIVGRFPTPPATSATADGGRSTAPRATAPSAWACWATVPSPSAILMYDTQHTHPTNTKPANTPVIMHYISWILFFALQVPPAMFCEMWVRDVEYVNNPCVALAAYAASCHKFNICMEWRSSDFCRM